jgi:adenylate kinase family enzyme
MKIFILFGKAGCGKSFVGDFLQNRYHWLHFDADQMITDKMKEYIRLEKQMPVALIDEYMEILKTKIKYFYETQAKIEYVL